MEGELEGRGGVVVGGGGGMLRNKGFGKCGNIQIYRYLKRARNPERIYKNAEDLLLYIPQLEIIG